MLADVVGHARLLDLGPVLIGGGRIVLAELLADGVHLLAQEVLALLFLGAALHVVADPAADLHLRQALLLEADGEVEAIDHVELLEQFDLLLVAQVGRVAGGVGEGSGLVDRAQERADPVVGVAEVEDLLDHGAVLAFLGSDLVVALGRVVVGRDLDSQGAVDAGAGDAGGRRGGHLRR